MSSRPLRFVLATLVLSLVVVASAGAEAPQLRTAASVSGSATVGGTLTAHNGTWLYDNGLSCQSECQMTYQWQRCNAAGTSCSDIGGATGRFYTVQSADAGSRLRAMETMSIYDCGATNTQTGVTECRWDRRSGPSGMTAVAAGGSAPMAPAPPAAPAPQAPLAPTPTAAPTINGVAMVDEVLTAAKGTWSGSPTLALEWLRCDAAGQNCVGMGLTAESYRVIAFDIGKTLRVLVTGRNPAALRTALSDPTPVVSELMPSGQKPSLAASQVVAPHKLVISGLDARPVKVVRRGSVTLRLVVSDSRGFRISGALVTAVALPVRAFAVPAVATSGADGAVMLVFEPGPKLELRRLKAVTFVVTARRPGDRLISPRAATARLKLGVVQAKKSSRR